MENFNQTIESTKMYISKLILNTDESIEVNSDDIIVFVGPNNVGKSKALNDIKVLCGVENDTQYRDVVIVKDIDVKKEGMSNIKQFVLDSRYGVEVGNQINIAGNNYSENQIQKNINNKYYGILSNIFVMHITAGYIHYANAANNNNMGMMSNTEPIHFLNEIKEYRLKASEGFRKAFGKDLLPHRMKGESIPLCIGDEAELDKKTCGKSGNDSLDAYKEVMDKMPQIQNQSDGIKSFTSTLVNLVIKTRQTYLLDEPETFLHPPQAYIMGRLIGELLDQRQAFISTHSQDIIKGLLEVCPQRVKIVRITRDNNINYFKVLDNSKIRELWKDTLLRYSDMLNGLFHENVVLCESDSDCKLYSIILENIKEEHGYYSQTQFIQSNGKQRISKMVVALRDLGINVFSVVDIDIFSNEYDLRKLIESYGDDWSKYKEKYNLLIANLNSNVTHIDRSEIKEKIDDIIKSSNKKELSKEEVNKITKALSYTSKWGIIKKSGIHALPTGDGYNAYMQIEKMLKEKGIFVVNVGELENFIKSVGGHGPEWVSKVLEEYKDINGTIYDEIRNFVKSWGI